MQQCSKGTKTESMAIITVVCICFAGSGIYADKNMEWVVKKRTEGVLIRYKNWSKKAGVCV